MITEFLWELFHRLQTLTWPTVILTVITGFVAWFVYQIVQEKLSPLRKIPSPPGRLPFFGHLFSLWKHGGLHMGLREWEGRYGPIIAFGPGFGRRSERVVIYDKDLIRQVMISESHKYRRPEIVKDIIPGVGNGLFASSGKVHAKQRKMINPAFSLTNLKTFVPAFVESAEELVELWTRKIQNSSTVDVGDDICHLTLDIIGKTSFGYGFNTVLGKETEVSTAFNTLLNGAEFGYVVRSRMIPFYRYLPFSDNLAIKKSISLVNSTVFKVINERRMLREQGKAADHKDLLNLLLEMYDEETGAGFDDEELRAQVFTFMLAGHETTSTSLSWTLYELAKNPEIQDKIRQEIKGVLKEGEELTWTKLDQLEYLGCMIKESLRLHGPASFVGRETNQTVHIGGYEIPKNTFVTVPIDALHLSPDLWENPLDFIPERFMKTNASPMNQYPFLPFSFGPRICIGYKFAMAEMKTIVLTLMKNFKLTAVPGFKVKSFMKLTTKPDPSVKVQISLLH
ncbi:taurochenodeoxycholic 6 alpha-hydroxylase isoform X1 [Exaiptasia diaphana]|uniref:Cytochrome P450 n=1 Tax=Exaiptasia diaphana TaxID=2652724 RepID=A0A913XQ65_EXADI|nr:taurochenodeoxycholic 6 alpha-hydroxylase isoform X1 [Exaiptasia diaphana]